MDKTALKTPEYLQAEKDFGDILNQGRSAVKDLGYVPRNHKKCDGTGVQGSKMLYDPKIKKKRRYWIVCDCVLDQIHKKAQGIKRIARDAPPGSQEVLTNWG